MMGLYPPTPACPPAQPYFLVACPRRLDVSRRDWYVTDSCRRVSFLSALYSGASPSRRLKFWKSFVDGALQRACNRHRSLAPLIMYKKHQSMIYCRHFERCD